MKSYIIIGLGRFGFEMARRLTYYGNEVLAIDYHPEAVQRISNEVTHAVVGDARDKEVLKALDVKNFDCAIVAIGDNLAASVLATINLKELNVPMVICKAYDDTQRKVLEKLGADRVLIPEQEIANRLARSLSTKNVLDYIELSEDSGIAEIEAPKRWVGKTLRELNIRPQYGVSIIAYRREKQTVVSPGADYEIHSNDVLVILGSDEQLAEVQKL